MSMKKAYFAAGCYWGVEHYFQKLNGVKETTVGFMGGDDKYSNYEEVKTGITGHAEVLEVCYDSKIVSFKELVIYFFRLHDPTTLNRQHNDVGTQYRSAIFTDDLQEKEIAQRIIIELEKAEVFSSKIVTTIDEKGKFHAASGPHQDYLKKNPGGYNCHTLGQSLT